jgi:hypothetical protein
MPVNNHTKGYAVFTLCLQAVIGDLEVFHKGKQAERACKTYTLISAHASVTIVRVAHG